MVLGVRGVQKKQNGGTFRVFSHFRGVDLSDNSIEIDGINFAQKCSVLAQKPNFPITNRVFFAKKNRRCRKIAQKNSVVFNQNFPNLKNKTGCFIIWEALPRKIFGKTPKTDVFRIFEKTQKMTIFGSIFGSFLDRFLDRFSINFRIEKRLKNGPFFGPKTGPKMGQKTNDFWIKKSDDFLCKKRIVFLLINR